MHLLLTASRPPACIKTLLAVVIMEQILKELKACKTFYDFLVYIRDTEGLEIVQDNGWYWIEYNGEEVEGTAKERFTSSSEMNDLLRLAGL